MKKRLLAMILVLVMLLSLVPSSAFATASNDYTQWKQFDPEWNQTEAWPASRYPDATMRWMKEAGCAVTSVSMLLRHYNVVTDSNVNNFNPWICNTALGNAGALNSAADIVWGNISNAYPGFVFMNIVSYSAETLVSLYNQGYACIVGVNYNSHYVAVRSATNTSNIVIMDPGKSNNTSLSAYGGLSSIVYFKTTPASMDNTTPGKPTLTNFKRSYSSGETTVFNWNSTDNTTHYNLYIDRRQPDGSWEVDYRVWHYAKSGFSAGFEDGIYRVLLQSVNSNKPSWPYTNGEYITFAVGSHSHEGKYVFYEAAHPHCNCYECYYCGEIYRKSGSSNYIDSCLECHRPDKPILLEMKNEYLEFETVTFSWNSTENTTHYNLYIDRCQPDGSWEVNYRVWHYAISGFTAGFEEGYYRVTLQSTNSDYWESDGSSWLYTNSDYKYFTVNPKHTHNYELRIAPPTCTEQGYTTHTCACGDSYVDSYVDALGHDFGEWTVTTAPTCTEKGVETRYCSRCDAFETREVDALGHDLVHHDGKAATCTEAGWEEYDTCSRCDYTTYEEIPASGHDYKDGVCTRCGAKDPDYIPPVVKDNPFVDVSESSVYYDAILWAYYHEPQQITGGYTATEFRPGNPCTRGQVVTFLWRAAGCPEPTGDTSMFKDASSIASPYRKAVAWAVENGITTGFADGTFRPNESVTRAQFVTFLWRYENRPATSGSIAGFTDAASISGPYQQAVAWAVEKGITTGYNDGTFRPNATCTRWAVVLFMYRDMT